MIFLINNDFDTVKATVQFPCRIAKYHDKCVITTHKDHDNQVVKNFEVLSVIGNSLDFDYKIPEWVYLGLGCTDHLQSFEYKSDCIATITDGIYCLSVRGELIIRESIKQ